MGVGERIVDERPEMIAWHFSLVFASATLHRLDTPPELLRRNERRQPAIPQPAGAAHRRLALSTDPDRRRFLDRLRKDRDAVEPVEFALERDLVLQPEAADDLNGLVGPAAASRERHSRGLEPLGEFHADAHRRNETPA